MKRIIGNYYKQLYVKKLENPEEMEKFLDIHSLLKLSHEDTENLNRSITKMNTELVIKTLPAKKSSGPSGFTAEFNQTLKELIPILLKL